MDIRQALARATGEPFLPGQRERRSFPPRRPRRLRDRIRRWLIHSAYAVSIGAAYTLGNGFADSYNTAQKAYFENWINGSIHKANDCAGRP